LDPAFPLTDNPGTMSEERVREIAAESVALKQRFFDANAALLVRCARAIAERLRAGGKVLIFGNGGSAADAQHFAAELMGRFARERAALPALALTTDTSALTAIGNDYGFERICARQIEAPGGAGDVAIGISTSGRSANVVAALTTARARGLLTIGLTGRGGGALPPLCDVLVDVPHSDTARIQEVHAMVVHVLSELVEESLAR
jgi:D-sedoheptulose 7-phosphate isomerase